MVALIALGVRIISHDELRERLGATYTSIAVAGAGIAVVLLALHIYHRLFGRPNG